RLCPYRVNILAYALCLHLFLFFFSSRRRHTRWPRDWSSDVCSSDLHQVAPPPPAMAAPLGDSGDARRVFVGSATCCARPAYRSRSEERRVGKECRSRWSAYH